MTLSLAEVFRQIPLLCEFSPTEFSVTRLAGLTNLNYRIHNHRFDWVLRVPKPRTGVFIDRIAERHNLARACELGLAPAPVWQDRQGLMLTPTITASRVMMGVDFEDTYRLNKILAMIHELHQSGIPFRGEVDLSGLLGRYFSMLSAVHKDRLRSRFKRAKRLIESVNRRDRLRVPSHNDLVLDNILLAPSRNWIVDWEYSSMASPYWDLATLCNSGSLSRQQSVRLMERYCGTSVEMEESLLFDYRHLLQCLSDFWMAAFHPG